MQRLIHFWWFDANICKKIIYYKTHFEKNIKHYKRSFEELNIV
jgi:hypothetical protein